MAAAGFRVLALDMKGYGESTAPPGDVYVSIHLHDVKVNKNKPLTHDPMMAPISNIYSYSVL